ncbi:MAG: hypothetical protein ABI370_02510 [Gammaproteobacteria bacterium]
MFNRKELELLQKAETKKHRPRIQENNTSSGEQLLVASNSLVIAEALEGIPSIAELEQTPLSAVGYAKWAFLLHYISPAFLLAPWYSFFKAAKQFYRAENRNFEQYSNVFVSFVSAVGWTILTVVGLGAIGGGLFYAAPYILATILGLKALSSVINSVRNFYNGLPWEGVKQLVSAVTYTLGFVISIFLGIEMSQAIDKIANGLANEAWDAVTNGLQTAASLFAEAMPVFYGLAASAILGAAMETKKINERTLHLLAHPIETLTNAWNKILSNPWQIINPFKFIPAITIAAVSIAALVFLPLQLIGFGLKKLFTRQPAAPVAPEPVVDTEKQQEADRINLITDLKAQIAVNADRPATSERSAKLVLAKLYLTRIQTEDEITADAPDVNEVEGDQQALSPDESTKLVTFAKTSSLENLVSHSKTISSNVHNAFFKSVSKTQELGERLKHYEDTYIKPNSLSAG